jgi:spore coat protein CotH
MQGKTSGPNFCTLTKNPLTLSPRGEVMIRRFFHIRPLLAVVTIVLTAVAAQGGKRTAAANEESNRFFADTKSVPRIVISPDKETLDKLRRDPRKYVGMPVTVDGVEFKDVAVHLKGGAGSFRNVDDRPALTLNFDKFVDKQKYRGLDKIHLNNSVQDPAWMTEIVCGDLFLAVGVPTARATHAIVKMANLPPRLYVVKEGYNRTFLKRHFTNIEGNLYDGGFCQDINGNLERNSGHEDKNDHADLRALVDACGERDLAKRKERIEKVLDLDRFINLAALEVMCWHWDGYCLKPNNYRVYHDPAADKIIIIPHGMDQMFGVPGGDTNGPISAPGNGLVARAVFEVPEWRKRYYERIAELRKSVFQPDLLNRRVDELTEKLMPVLKEVDPRLAREFPNRAKQLKEQIRHRTESIDRQLAERAKRAK